MAADRGGETAPRGARDRHAAEGRKTRGRPCGLIQQAGRHPAADPPTELAEEGARLAPEGAKGADREDDEAHASQ